MASNTVRIDPPEPKYTLFNATRNDLPEVVFVNEALLAFPHLEIFPWHLSIEIHYSEFADNKMPSTSESELLNDICDEIENLVLSGMTEFGAVNALFLARSTWNGIRELAFQVHDPEVTHQTLQRLLQSREWKRFWRFKMSNDPDWKNAGYFFKLFPSAKGNDA